MQHGLLIWGLELREDSAGVSVFHIIVRYKAVENDLCGLLCLSFSFTQTCMESLNTRLHLSLIMSSSVQLLLRPSAVLSHHARVYCT